MSFGGFIGSSSSGGNGGGDGGSGVSRVVADSPYNNTMPTAATIAHQSQQLVTSPLTQPMFNSSPLSLALVCIPLKMNFFFCCSLCSCYLGFLVELI